MKRLLALLVCLFPLSLFGAAGDITGVNVEPSGWVLNLTYAGATNGTFAFGLGTDNALTGNEKVKLTVTSPGFDDDGVSNTITRIIYGTKQLRLPYPQQAVNDVITNSEAGTCEIRLALSDYVYAGDTATYSIGTGFYTGNNAASGTLTINSTVPYYKPVANWSWRGFRVIDEEYMTLRVVAFHSSAREGRPVRMVEFRVKDSADNWFTNKQTVMQIDRSMGDQNPVQEYIARFATNTLASGLVTCDALVYPWLGDSTAILKSSENIAEPGPFFCTLTNAVNYPRVRAVVSNSGGTGLAAVESYWATNTSPAEFNTIYKAVKAIYDTNASHYGRSGTSGGIVYLKDGSYEWADGSALANGPDVELLVMPYPGQTDANITNRNANTYFTANKDLTRLYGIKIHSTATLATFALHAQLWFDNCHIHDHTGGTFWLDGNTTAHMSTIFTHCVLSNLMGNLVAATADFYEPSLIRGNDLRGITGLRCYTVLGNSKGPIETHGLTIQNEIASMGGYTQFPFIIAYNTFYDQIDTADIGDTFDLTNGGAIIQNIFECGDADFTGNRAAIYQAALASTNLLIWNNAFTGANANVAYNEPGTAPLWHTHYSVKNNIFDGMANKTDINSTGNGARTGNWAVVYGVAFSGNFIGATTNVAIIPGGQDQAFVGLYSHEDADPQPTNYWKPVARGGFDGVTVQPSPGNFRLSSSSPAHTRNSQNEWLLPYDLEGNARGKFGPPGSYSSAAPRKGGGFF